MNKKEVIKECIAAIENGAGITEVSEYIEEYSDFDPAEIISEIYKNQVFI